jgi:hypothetical protein
MNRLLFTTPDNRKPQPGQALISYLLRFVGLHAGKTVVMCQNLDIKTHGYRKWVLLLFTKEVPADIFSTAAKHAGYF